MAVAPIKTSRYRIPRRSTYKNPREKQERKNTVMIPVSRRIPAIREQAAKRILDFSPFCTGLRISFKLKKKSPLLFHHTNGITLYRICFLYSAYPSSPPSSTCSSLRIRFAMIGIYSSIMTKEITGNRKIRLKTGSVTKLQK